MGNVCVKDAQLAQVEASDLAAAPPEGSAMASPPSAAKLAVAVASKSSSKAAKSKQTPPGSPRPPSGSKGPPSPRAGHKKICFAEGPATEWQIPAAADVGDQATSTAQPQQP